MVPTSPTSGAGSRRLPFLRPSTSTSPSPSSPSSTTASTAEVSEQQRDLAVAADGSYVETTSEAAARAMARFYASQAQANGGGGGTGGGGEGKEGEEYGVQRVERDGRVVYRIRPLAKPSTSPTSPTSASSSSGTSSSSAQSGHLPFARPSHQPTFSPSPSASPSPAPLPAKSAATAPPPPAIELHRSSVTFTLRHSQSIPVLPSSVSSSAASDSTSFPPCPTTSTSTSSGGLLSPISAAFPSPSPTPGPSSSSSTPPAPASTISSSPLKKAGSSPSLRSSALFPSVSSSPSTLASPSVPNFSAPRARRSPAGSTEGDVLGRILGWRAALEGDAGRGVGGSRSRREGTAGVGRVELGRLTSGGSSGSGSGMGTKASTGGESDRSDLPEDLLEILDASSAPELPFAALAQKRPSMSHFASPSPSASTSPPHPATRLAAPFGAGVRIPRARRVRGELDAVAAGAGGGAGAGAREGEAQEAELEREREREMREVASNDSIRTARAVDTFASPFERGSPPRTPPPQSQPHQTTRRRFEDPAVFDVFHRSSLPSSSSSGSSPSGAYPPHPLPTPPSSSSTRPHIAHHGRLPSSASLASSTHSSTSGTSQSASGANATASGQQITLAPAPGDDPRFCIWGTRDAPASPAVQPPTSPPSASTRRGSAAVVGSPSTPGRGAVAGYDADLLRRQSIAEEGAAPLPPPLSPSASSAATNSPAGSSRRWSVSQRGGGGGGGGVQSSPGTSVRDSVGSSSKDSNPSHPAQRLLMAATVERLVAELTSQISADLLADFFLTYRHYLAPLDLLNLLLTRFDWAMAPPSPAVAASLSAAEAAEDDALRRVVRVRTFVVLRYWLMNSHFMEDFYPSREMRSTLTTWLNERSRADSPFRASQKDLRLIKQLKKTVRRCKEVYVVGAAAAVADGQGQAQGGGRSPALGAPDEDVDLEEEEATTGGDGLAGAATNATASLSPAGSGPPPASATGSFAFRTRAKLFPSAFTSSSVHSSPPPALLPSVSSPSSGSSPFATATDPFHPISTAAQNPIARSFSSAMGTFGRFRRRLAAHRVGGGGSGGGGSDAGLGEAGGALGGGGRGELELERNEAGDLLWVKGGLERYLEYWGIEREPEEAEEQQEEGERDDGTPALVADRTPEGLSSSSSSEDALTPRPDLAPIASGGEPASVEVAAPVDDRGVGLGLGIVTTAEEAVGVVQPTAPVDYSFPPPSAKSAAFGAPPPTSTFTRPPIPIFDPASYHDDHDSDSAPPSAPAPAYTFTLDPSLVSGAGGGGGQSSFRPRSTRIELDDLDSDEDDDYDDDVVEATRTLKRLPAAHNLRGQVHVPPHHLQRSVYRRSMDSEMSYGFGAGELGAPWLGLEQDYPRDSIMYVDDEEGVEPGVAVIPNFILDGLDVSDDEEPGDVEAALRRLEGLVDDAKEREKKRRVERQMEKSERLQERRRRRAERIERGEEVPPEEEDDEEAEGQTPPSLGGSSRRGSLAPTVEENEDDEGAAANEPVTLLEALPEEPAREAAVVAVASTVGEAPPTPPTLPPPPVGYSSSKSPPLSSAAQTRRTTGQPTSPPSVAAAPASAATFRKPSFSRIFGARPLSSRPAAHPHPSAGLAAPPTHRSFLFFCRTETLAQQFTLIERDMLRMLSYQELVSGAWRDRTGETDVLDWEAYLKDRRRSDVLARERGETPQSAVQDIIARFNLTANWTASEILLTASIDERALLIAKFIRLAFKCYRIANLQTLTAIVHGLQIPDVERLKRTWAKVPAWEMRKFRGMQEFTSHLKNFKHLRDITNALANEYGSPGQRSSGGDAISAGAAKGCIPFLGIFLRDLALNAELPTFLDPTSPNTPASVSSSGSLTSIVDPLAFSDYPPLPSGVDLAPLVNVHKFRILAGTVHRVVAFQELASRYAHEPSAGAYFKCLKIRCLDQAVMHELSAKLEA
ncbi:hypothetical protein JCM6882_008589 [Rhodosporidiobolus microsporus]